MREDNRRVEALLCVAGRSSSRETGRATKRREWHGKYENLKTDTESEPVMYDIERRKSESTRVRDRK